MYSLLFRNRWFALGWVFLMIFSVVTFFADGGGHEMLDTATDDIRTGSGTILGPGVSRRVDNGGFADDTPGVQSGVGFEEEMAEEATDDDSDASPATSGVDASGPTPP